MLTKNQKEKLERMEKEIDRLKKEK